MRGTSRLRTAVRYSLDERNRLLVREPGDSFEPLRPVRVMDGAIAVGRGNRLVYHAASAPGRGGSPGPRDMEFDGTWGLTHDHELALSVRESDARERQTLHLKGALVQAQANALVFALRREEETEGASEQLTISGRWAADAQNRLTFLVDKADGSEDRLTLQGGWELGPHHELLYRYRQRAASEERTLLFNGAWDITSADRLVYRLSGSDDSAFEFKAALQSPSLLASDRRVVYQVGIGLSGGKTHRQRVTLFGAWKLNRDRSVSFDIPYADGRIQAIRFEGSTSLGPRNRLKVELSTGRREPLGLTVTFTKELVPDVNLFLRLRKDAEDTSAIGGIQVRF